MNMGDSMAVKECMKLHHTLLHSHTTLEEQYSEFINFLTTSIDKDPNFLTQADTEIVEYYLGIML